MKKTPLTEEAEQGDLIFNGQVMATLTHRDTSRVYFHCLNGNWDGFYDLGTNNLFIYGPGQWHSAPPFCKVTDLTRDEKAQWYVPLRYVPPSEQHETSLVSDDEEDDIPY
jgi:hypothetical protein